ncbi:NADPH-dependent FMN reductase [Bacillus sp. REN16]|uniref:NADPH-dependent FMN reductase n=1 Tax=Bacillus sp. REN16 TaxID=2887296 RepID=UPI001E3F2996|nr:NADPH-dependent FMN reductase [Bacillus sp. REN16]MCC3359215.1 NAD(P)H-dependent oxidoreductase [Bacillus sp. REN16]
MNIVTLVGSLRKSSFNMQIAKTMQERYKEKLNIQIADIGALPHFNQDDELNPPQVVKDFKASIANADGVIIITPEYNWSVPGVLKNALDWTSRVEQVFVGKPVMTLGATPGMMGTIRAQLHLRDILVAPGIQANILPPGANEILINFASQKIDGETGQLVDETTLGFLDSKVDAFVDFVKQV